MRDERERFQYLDDVRRGETNGEWATRMHEKRRALEQAAEDRLWRILWMGFCVVVVLALAADMTLRR